MCAEASSVPPSVRRAREVFLAEISLLQQVAEALGESFHRAVDLIMSCRGIVFVSGVGKSGIIGRKIAATLASTGTRATFIHPVEGAHGDLGMIREDDLLFLLSKSGESLEILPLLNAAKRKGLPVIAVVGKEGTTLVRAANVSLVLPLEPEACPMNLAPTSSTTAMLCLGDALAIVLLEKRGFREEQFASLHPGGNLGRRLLLQAKTVGELMHGGDKNPVVSQNASMQAAVQELVGKRLGGVNVVDDQGVLVGLIVDGDLKRALTKFGDALLHQPVAAVMTRDPTVIRAEALAAEAVHLLENRPFQILVLPVVDADRRAVGMIRLHDLVKAGLV
jgi:arabinose-5-phosphate isomerase